MCRARSGSEGRESGQSRRSRNTRSARSRTLRRNSGYRSHRRQPGYADLATYLVHVRVDVTSDDEPAVAACGRRRHEPPSADDRGLPPSSASPTSASSRRRRRSPARAAASAIRSDHEGDVRRAEIADRSEPSPDGRTPRAVSRGQCPTQVPRPSTARPRHAIGESSRRFRPRGVDDEESEFISSNRHAGYPARKHQAPEDGPDARRFPPAYESRIKAALSEESPIGDNRRFVLTKVKVDQRKEKNHDAA